MFYPNLIKGKLKYKNFNFAPFNKHINSKLDEKTLPFGSCSNLYNFNTSSGALIDGVGIDDITLIWDSFYDLEYKTLDLPLTFYIAGCYFFKYWESQHDRYLYFIIIYGANKKLYYNIINGVNTEWHEIKNINFTAKPIALYSKVNGVDSIIFYSKEDGMYVWNYHISQAYKVENSPLITSMCIHDNRMFATIDGEARSIIFSEELNPINFNVSTNEGGYIDMGDDFGKCNKVISFDGDLYVFRDYHIAKVTESKDRNEFVVNQIYAGNGKIYPNSVSICGNKIMFLASDGIYEFDGTKAKKIDLEFDNMIVGVDNHFAIAQYISGYYYLACVMDFNDDYVFACETFANGGNNALLKINVNDNSCEVHRGCDIREFTPINDGVNDSMIVTYAFDLPSTSIGILKDNGCVKRLDLRKKWKSAMFDFDIPNKNKFVKEISFISKSNIILNICLDDKVKSYNIKGKDDCQTIKINEKARRVGVEFISNFNNNYISIPQLKVGFYE